MRSNRLERAREYLENIITGSKQGNLSFTYCDGFLPQLCEAQRHLEEFGYTESDLPNICMFYKRRNFPVVPFRNGEGFYIIFRDKKVKSAYECIKSI